jgi:hypothetical protein
MSSNLAIMLARFGAAAVVLGCGGKTEPESLRSGDYHHPTWRLSTVSLRLVVPAGTFALVVDGCDFVENEAGVLRRQSGSYTLAPSDGAAVLRWPLDSGDVGEVSHVTVSQGGPELRISLPTDEVQTWRAGGMCPGWCDDPETYAEMPPPVACEPQYE